MFFSEEKNQKTFVPAPISAAASLTGADGDISFGQKFFGFFFKKELFSAFLFDGSMSTRVGIICAHLHASVVSFRTYAMPPVIRIRHETKLCTEPDASPGDSAGRWVAWVL